MVTPNLPPEFEVLVSPPDIGDWLSGNSGVPGFTTLESGAPGPHAAILALTHGNEISGAIVLDRLLRAGIRPRRGRLTLGFVNIEAYRRFDPRRPTASRFIDEDINRVWEEAILDGPRHSRELDRAREIRPLIETVEVLLDLHSMLWPSDPLILCGGSPKGAQLARGIGTPSLVVADHGHANGRRIIDYTRFSDPATPWSANLVEAGQHWLPSTVDTVAASVDGFLRHAGMIEGEPAAACGPQRFAVVTDAVTAISKQFAFTQPYHGGEIVARRNTLIAMDGPTEIRTPYDDCLLVMPSLRPHRGHTAVRLARFEGQ